MQGLPLHGQGSPFSNPTSSEINSMEQYFGPGGLLSKKLKGFEFRAPQLEMAQAVQECLSECGTLLVEAGTGTGKTWGYLIPAILAGKTTLVSTGTKTLQDQILDHDVPLLRRILFPQLKAVCLKGRKNYLCQRRFKDFSYQPTLYDREEAKLFRRLQTWASRTSTGDRAEIDWLPDHYNTWHEVSSNGDQCLGQLCEHNSRCFLSRLRGEASRARLIVVNHHLFFADLFLRSRHLGEVIPEHDAVILDEAHQIEDIAGLYFGLEFSSVSLHELSRDIQRESSKGRNTAAYPREVHRVLQQLYVQGRLLHHQVQKNRGVHGRFSLDPADAEGGFGAICRQTIHALEHLGALLSPLAEKDAAVEALCRRSGELAACARLILEQRDPSLVYWCECTPHAVFMRGTPVQVGDVLKDLLFTGKRPTILTSATLAAAGSLEYLKRSLGAHEEAKELILPSPYDFGKQALLYVPLHTPSPQDPAFCGLLADEAAEILLRSRGRALFLFTSYRHMNDVHAHLKERLPFPLLIQGQKPKRALLAEFRDRIDSVLLATSSFWQGVDMPGETLSCLLIDKLPFEVPDDPVIAARMATLSEHGRSPFFDYQVPRAIIQLKQGVGRLIRSSSDRGLIVIFDNRLFTKRYGRLFLRSLPPCRVVHRLEDIDASLFPLEGASPVVMEKGL